MRATHHGAYSMNTYSGNRFLGAITYVLVPPSVLYSNFDLSMREGVTVTEAFREKILGSSAPRGKKIISSNMGFVETSQAIMCFENITMEMEKGYHFTDVHGLVATIDHLMSNSTYIRFGPLPSDGSKSLFPIKLGEEVEVILIHKDTYTKKWIIHVRSAKGMWVKKGYRIFLNRSTCIA